ncbi:metallophosphoesterase [Alcaligenaceae bacterium]|nr:metallophosphoesterase [Alcaligenaceae bacterium]
MLHIVSAVIGVYTVIRFVLPLPWCKTNKALFAALLFLLAQHHLIEKRIFGSIASPEMPAAVIMLLGWAYGAVLLLAMLLVIRDVVGLLCYACSRKLGKALLSGHGVLYGTGLLVMLLSGVGVWEAVRVPRVKTVEITLPNLPQEFDGFRVVQLTDLHASRLLQQPWMAAVVAKANALNPDLTVITGDLVDGTPQARAADVEPLRALTARYGVYAVPGNHEYYVNYVGWMEAFKQLELPMLLNEHVVITHKGSNLILAGITDRVAYAYHDLPPSTADAVNGAIPSDPVILLSHRPVSALDNAAEGVDLQLSGHTHGGQIYGGHLLVQWANEGFVSGLYQVGTMQMYVSNGTGLWNGFPIRLGRPSEITQIVLRSAI